MSSLFGYCKHAAKKQLWKKPHKTARLFRWLLRKVLVKGRGFFNHFKTFQNISCFDVIEVFKTDTAFKTFGDFFHVVFHAAERSDFTCVNNNAVTQKPDAAVALHFAVRDHAAGDDADFRHTECLADFRLSQVNFFAYRREHARHGAFDFFHKLVN